MTHGARELGELGAAVLTISTSRARGEGEDESGPALAAFAERLGATVIGTEVIPDERELIEGRLRWWCDEGGCELVLTTGGTGLRARRRHPGGDARRDRARGARDRRGDARRLARAHRVWMLSRGVAGTRGRTLIVNFPGNPPAIEQAGAAIADALPHALELLAGRRRHEP